MYKKSRALKEIRQNIAQGAGVYNACKAAGVTYYALWSWRNKRPIIDRYMDKVLTQRTQLVEDALYKGALSGNTTAQIFYLKNRGKNWKDAYEKNENIKEIRRVEVVVTGDPEVLSASKTRRDTVRPFKV